MAQFTASAIFTAIDRFTNPVKKMTNAMIPFKKQLREATSPMGKFNKRMKDIGITSLGSALGITAIAIAMKKVVNIGGDFEQSIANLGAITGLSGDELNKLESDIIGLSGKYIIASEDIAKAFTLVGSAKPELLQSSSALKQVTESALLLKNAGGMPLEQATESLTTVMNQFKLSTKDASKAVDILAAGELRGSSSIINTTDALKKFGAQAQMSGMSVEESVAVLQVLAKTMQGAEAGTKFRAILTNLEIQMNDKFKPSVVGIVQAFKNLNDAQLDTKKITKLVLKENIAAYLAIATRTKMLEDMTNKVSENGLSQELASKKTATFNKRWESLKIALQNAAIVIFPILKTAIVLIFKPLISLINYFTATKDRMNLLKVVFAVTVVLLAKFLALLVVSKVLAFVVAIKKMVIAIKAFNLAMNTNPIVLIITLAITGIILLIAYWKEIKEAIFGATRAVAEFFGFGDDQEKLQAELKKDSESTENINNASTIRNEIASSNEGSLDVNINVEGNVNEVETTSTGVISKPKVAGSQLL